MRAMTSRAAISRFPLQPCPYCGASLDAAGSPDGTPMRPPEEGDYLLCFTCGEPAVWSVGPFGVALRKPTAEELAEFAVEHGHHVERLRRFHSSQGEGPR